MRFVDTNIILYSISDDPTEEKKARIAREVMESRDLALSVQVIQEFYVQATHRRRSKPLTHEQATGLIQTFMRFPIQEMSMAIALLAMANSEQFHISYWDSAIIEAARVMKCEVVLSEDLNHEQDYNGVRVINPFVV